MVIALRIFFLTAAWLYWPSTVHADETFERLPVTGGVLLIDWRGEFSAEQRIKLKTWLAAVGDTVTRLHGSLPRKQIRIELTAYPAGRSAVQFARVKRRAPQGLEFFINPAMPLENFVNDWTAYHEFTHLFIPFPGNADIWFSEGLASYYQNVLQFRAGLLTEQQAWQKLYDGFERGRAADNDEQEALTLAALSPRMRQDHAFMRVYWSGALYFLEADLALRARSGGRQSLDTILKEFGSCCLERRQRWNGAAIAAEFDRLAGSDTFRPLYERYEETTAIPAYLPLLEAAGVRVTADRTVVTSPGFLSPVPPE